MKRYSISITFKCDWDCSYCSADTHSRKSPSFEHIKEVVGEVKFGSEVSLTGGEPGFAQPKVLEYVIEELKAKGCTIVVNTNGAFFTRYPEYCEVVDSFFYHCSEDLDTSKEIYIPDSEYDVDYMLVVTDENLPRLDHFMTNYPDITFLVTSADPAMVKGKMGSSLSRGNAIKIYRKYKDRLDKDCVLRLLESSEKLCDEEGIIMK